MNSINRLRARVFSALICLVALCAWSGAAACAQGAPPSYWFAGTRLIFANVQTQNGETAVATSDPGLQKLLTRVGATLAYAPGQNYISLTTADRRVIAFVLGDERVRGPNSTIRLPFAPYADGDDAYLPLLAVARALDILPVPGDGGETVLQPQLSALDVRTDSGKSYVVVRGATQLRPTIANGPDAITIVFTGVGSSLTESRRIGLPGLQSARVVVSGSVRAPVTTVTLVGGPNTTHVVYPVAAQNELELGFAPRGLALDPLPPPRSIASVKLPPSASPSARGASSVAIVPPPPPMPYGGASSAPTVEPPVSGPNGSIAATGSGVVTNLAITPTDSGATVAVTLSGSVSYDWHRLADNRFYIDLHGATLGNGGRDEKPNLPSLESVRIRQIGTPTAPVVRVALSLIGDKRVDVQANNNGFALLVGASDAVEVARSGTGHIGGPDANPTAIAALSASGTPPPDTGFAPPLGGPTPWKFGASPPPLANAPPGSNPRLIVLDAGHGGSDFGTMHNGLIEKTLTLQIAERLRALLVAQGWTVKMTRSTDVDVYGPNASDVNELQARVNVANYNAARLFISIHVNYYSDPSIKGTTTYYTKPEDLPLAKAVQRDAVSAAGTFDDGVRHGHLYVTNHTTMPAVLVETGFISNPGDVARFQSPAFLESMAQGIANGVKEYAGSPRSAVSAVPAGDQ